MDNASPTTRIDSLPSDALIYILRFIRFKPLMTTVRLVCKRWHSAAPLAVHTLPVLSSEFATKLFNSPARLRQFQNMRCWLTAAPPFFITREENPLGEWSKKITEIDARNSPSFFLSMRHLSSIACTNTETALQLLATNSATIESLLIDLENRHSPSEAPIDLPRLVSLELQNLPVGSLPDWIQTVLVQRASHLTCLHLLGSNFTTKFSLFSAPNLRTLQLGSLNASSSHSDAFMQWYGGLTALRNISLLLLEPSPHLLLLHATALRALSLVVHVNTPVNELVASIKFCTNLTRLAIRSGIGKGNKNIAAIVSAVAPQLRHLSYSNSTPPPPHIWPLCTRLESLSVIGPPADLLNSIKLPLLRQLSLVQPLSSLSFLDLLFILRTFTSLCTLTVSLSYNSLSTETNGPKLLEALRKAEHRGLEKLRVFCHVLPVPFVRVLQEARLELRWLEIGQVTSSAAVISEALSW